MEIVVKTSRVKTLYHMLFSLCYQLNNLSTYKGIQQSHCGHPRVGELEKWFNSSLFFVFKNGILNVLLHRQLSVCFYPTWKIDPGPLSVAVVVIFIFILIWESYGLQYCNVQTVQQTN